MRAVINILQKVLVNQFYSVNAGFFLFTFFVAFGIPQNVKQFHLSLIEGIVQNPSILLLVMCAWLLYNIKCMDYIIKLLIKPQQRFLYSLCSLSYVRQYAYFLYVQVMVYMPVLVYTIFAIVMGLQKGYYACAAETMAFTLAVIGLTPVLYIRALQHRPLLAGSMPRVILKLGKPLFSLPMFNVWRHHKQMLLVSKMFSLSLLYIFIKLYQPDHYDIRPTLLCIMVAAAANSAILFEIKVFEDFFLQMQRNFPLTLLRRFGNAGLCCLLLMLPELLFVFKGYPLYFTIVDYIQLLLLGVGLLLLLYACLFTSEINMDGYIKLVFAFMAILFFIILYNPGILLGIAINALALGIYASYYYGFEREYK